MKYIPTVGIECHVQLKTKTKLFEAVGNDAREAPPNTLISHISAGLPGALPVLNKAAIKLSVLAALALGVEPQKFCQFERKHYFYPDLPKGYQITQYANPIILGGDVEIEVNGQKRKIGIERANLEEDAGKNTHPAGADYSLVDLNRAGTPLLEIVSKPDIHSAAEAKAFARELWLNMRYAEVTDGDLYHGHVRFDVNISVSQAPKPLGTRTEIKNLNSFRSVENAVAYEIERQIDLLSKDKAVVQETRGWDEAKQKTVAQRTKEEAQDYRYMPEPDIPPVELDDKMVAAFKKDLPLLPSRIRGELSSIGLSEKVIENVLDKYNLADTILNVRKRGTDEDARRATFWLLEGWMEDEHLSNFNPQSAVTVSGMVSNNLLSSTAATIVFKEAVKSGRDPHELAKEMNLIQVSDESEIEKIVVEVIAENPKVVDDIKAGQEKAISFLVGQVMAKSKGQANPGLAQQVIKRHLAKDS